MNHKNNQNKTKRNFITFFILLIVISASAQNKKVAVFDPAGNVQSSTKEIVREEISNVIVNSTGYSVLERSLIDKVLAENKFQSGGLVDDSQITEMGKMMGANFVFVTSITTLDDGNFYFSFKMIDVFTARIDKQRTARTKKKLNDIFDVVQKTVEEMFGIVSGTSEKFTTTNSQQTTKPVQTQQQQLPPQTTTQIQSSNVCGMVIMTNDLPDRYDWNSAKRACPQGWRLPTSDELQCLCNFKKSIGAKGKQYWTSDFDTKSNKAISRTFNDCKVEKENINNYYSVRCVKQ